MELLSQTRFDRTGHLQPSDAPEAAGGMVSFVAELDKSWASLRGVHGGYVASLAVRAAQMMLPDRAVRTVSTSFLRPAAVGPADLLLDVVRSGRSFSTVSARIRQADRDVAISRLTLLTHVDAAGWTTAVADQPAPLEECVPFAPPASIAHFTQAEFRIDPATVPASDVAAPDARIAGHLRPVESRAIDAPWLTAMGDWFPPSPFRRLVPPAGGISIDYTVHIHRTLPADDDMWLAGVFTSAENIDGIALEHGTLSTADGRAVAETFHTRWTG